MFHLAPTSALPTGCNVALDQILAEPSDPPVIANVEPPRAERDARDGSRGHQRGLADLPSR